MASSNQAIDEKQFRIIQEASETLMGKLKLDEVLSIALDKLVNSLDYQFSGILLIDEDHHTLVYKKMSFSPSLPKDFLDIAGISPEKIAISLDKKDHIKNLFAKCFLQNKALVTKNIYEAARPLLSQEKAKLIGEKLKAKRVITIPLQMKGKPFGVLGVISSGTETPHEEIELLKALANQIALAITNARDHEKIVEEYKKKLAFGNKSPEEIPNIKFTLRIDDEIEQYLVYKTANTKQSKAQYVRDLLELRMKRDKDFEKF